MLRFLILVLLYDSDSRRDHWRPGRLPKCSSRDTVTVH